MLLSSERIKKEIGTGSGIFSDDLDIFVFGVVKCMYSFQAENYAINAAIISQFS